MTRATRGLDPALAGYIRDHTGAEPPALKALRRATAERLSPDEADMQTGPEQAGFMMLLLRLMGARRCLEIGSFTGYGALAMALALPEDGRVVALDADARYPEIGRPFWRAAGVERKIELRLGPALESLDRLLDEGEADGFDFVFVDADKKSYDAYHERALRLVRPGGLIAFDNMLWKGRVADPSNADRQTEVLRALAAKLRRDARAEVSLLPVGDGLALVRRADA